MLRKALARVARRPSPRRQEDTSQIAQSQRLTRQSGSNSREPGLQSQRIARPAEDTSFMARSSRVAGGISVVADVRRAIEPRHRLALIDEVVVRRARVAPGFLTLGRPIEILLSGQSLPLATIRRRTIRRLADAGEATSALLQADVVANSSMGCRGQDRVQRK